MALFYAVLLSFTSSKYPFVSLGKKAIWKEEREGEGEKDFQDQDRKGQTSKMQEGKERHTQGQVREGTRDISAPASPSCCLHVPSAPSPGPCLVSEKGSAGGDQPGLSALEDGHGVRNSPPTCLLAFPQPLSR